MSQTPDDKRAPTLGSPLPIFEPTPIEKLPTVKALDAIWARIQDRPLWAPPTFWKWLKLNLRMRTRLLREEKVQIIAPKFKVNECASCTDNCCVGPHSTVLLRLHDIATLMDIGRTDLMTHQKPTFSEQTLSARQALKLQTSSSDWKSFPVLKQNSFHACAALDTDGKCTLFPYWPSACARFPYALDAENLEVFTPDAAIPFGFGQMPKKKFTPCAKPRLQRTIRVLRTNSSLRSPKKSSRTLDSPDFFNHPQTRARLKPPQSSSYH